MDDRKLDKLFQEKLESLTEKDHGIQGWENLATNTPSQRLGNQPFFTKTLIPIGLFLLFCSNLWLMYIVSKQNGQIDQFSAQLTSYETMLAERSIRVDTVFLTQEFNYQQGFSRKDLRGSNSPQQTESVHIKEKATDSFGLPTYSTSIEKPTPKVAVPSIFGEDPLFTSHTSHAFVFNNLAKPLKTFSRESETTGDKRVIKKDLSNEARDKKKRRNRSLSLEEFFRYTDVRIGFTLKKPNPKVNIGSASINIQPQLSLGFLLPNERWQIESGISWFQIDYDSDDLDQITTPEIALAQYPNIQSTYPITRIHEILAKSSILELPLSLRYNFHEGYKGNVFAKAGLLSRWFMTQDFTYEFLLDIGNKPIRSATAKNHFTTGTALFELGAEFKMRKNMAAELGLFYSQDFMGQGIEGTQYKMVGVQGTLWLNDH